MWMCFFFSSRRRHTIFLYVSWARRCIRDSIYIVKGGLTLNDFNEFFDTYLESDDVDTIAGYFMAGIGAIPGEKEQIDYDVVTEKDNLTLTSLEVDGTRLVKLRVTFHDQEIIEANEKDSQDK